MGKYLRKSKMAGDVALMEISQSSLGVLTRAKALALQRLKKDPSSSPVPAAADGVGGNYLQLRSRRLPKPPVLLRDLGRRRKLAKKETFASNPNPKARFSKNSISSNEVAVQNVVFAEGKEEAEISEKNGESDLPVEASFGENVLDIDGRGRTTRESTPCSFVREADTIRTPGSTTKPTSTTDKSRSLGSSSRHIPTTHEMDEFFAGPEEEQQKHFMDKYNFDPVNEKPLNGRYEWEKVKKP